MTPKIRRAVQLVDRSLFWLSYAANLAAAMVLVAMVLLVVVSVSARNLLGIGLVDAVTPGRIGMVLLVFLAIAWAMRQERHVSVDLVRNLLPHPWRHLVRAAGMSACLVAVAVVIYQSLQFALTALRLNEVIIGDIHFPAFPFQAVIPFGLSLMALEIVRRILLDLAVALNPRPPAKLPPEPVADY